MTDSRKRDVYMAKEMINLIKLNVFQKDLQLMMAQVNRKTKQIMQLLK